MPAHADSEKGSTNELEVKEKLNLANNVNAKCVQDIFLSVLELTVTLLIGYRILFMEFPAINFLPKSMNSPKNTK